MKTYLVKYKYTYSYLDENEERCTDTDCQRERFRCKKRDIEKEVRQRIIEEEIMEEAGDRLESLTILNYYVTTDIEL